MVKIQADGHGQAEHTMPGELRDLAKEEPGHKSFRHRELEGKSGSLPDTTPNPSP